MPNSTCSVGRPTSRTATPSRRSTCSCLRFTISRTARRVTSAQYAPCVNSVAMSEAEAIHRDFRPETSADPEVLYEYAHWHYRAGRFDETVTVLERLIAVCPDSPAAHNFLGFLRARQFAELHEGERLLRRALELDADYPAARCNLGWVLSEQGREEEARPVDGRGNRRRIPAISTRRFCGPKRFCGWGDSNAVGRITTRAGMARSRFLARSGSRSGAARGIR